MHAHSPHVTTVTTVNDRECVRRESVAKDIDRGLRQLVLFFAGAIASATTDAQRAVEKDGLLRYCLSVHSFT